MKITKKELVNIIKEEVEKALEEQSEFSPLDSPSQMLKKAKAAKKEYEQLMKQYDDQRRAKAGMPLNPDGSMRVTQATVSGEEHFPLGVPEDGLEHPNPKFNPNKIPYSDEEMKTFFNAEGGGGGISSLVKDENFRSATKRGRLLILKIAKKYINNLADPDLKGSEAKKWRSLYRKNHPNLKGMRRKRAAARKKKGFEAGRAKAAKSRETPTMKTITPPEVDSGPIV